jgi:hypothetical protein
MSDPDILLYRQAVHERLDERRFANACLSGDPHKLSVALPRLRAAVVQTVELFVPLDEQHRVASRVTE